MQQQDGSRAPVSTDLSLGRRAVFLDRDGVLNTNVWYADTAAWESPRTAGELRLASEAGPSLRLLRDAGFVLVLISNQPNGAKGKCTYEELDRIHARLVKLLAAQGVELDGAFYCQHHPEHTGACVCRKPSPVSCTRQHEDWGSPYGSAGWSGIAART